jgi:glycosyltransferase involved in cell wall biosynthesis
MTKIRRVVITAFEASHKSGTEAGLAWMWALAYKEIGLTPIVITSTSQTSEAMRMWQLSGIKLILTPKTEAIGAPTVWTDFFFGAAKYRHFRKFAEKVIDEEFSSADVLLHHVSWGSVRLRHPLPHKKSGTKVVWGPLGGGQIPVFRGLKTSAWVHEIARLLTFPIGLVNRKALWSTRKSPDLILATNLQSKKYLSFRGLPKIQLMLADGIIKIESRQEQSPDKTLTLLWAGRLVPSKRPDLAIKLMSVLNQTVKCRLLIAGDGPELDDLRKLVHASNLDVKFLGKVPWADMADLYRKSDFYLFHSMRDSSCPGILEAASHGLPSVGLRVSGAGDLVNASVFRGPSEFRVERRFVDEMAEEIRFLIQSPTDYDSVRQEALRFAEVNTWQSKVRDLLKRIEGL